MLFPAGIRAKKNGRSKNPLEPSNQTAILGAALLKCKDIQQFGCAAEGDGWFC